MTLKEMTKTASDNPGSLMKIAVNVAEVRALQAAGHNLAGKSGKEVKALYQSHIRSMGPAAAPVGRVSAAGAAPATGRLATSDVARSNAELLSATRRPERQAAMQEWESGNKKPTGMFGGELPANSPKLREYAGRRGAAEVGVMNQQSKNFELTNQARNAGTAAGNAEISGGGPGTTFAQHANKIWNQHIKPNWKPIVGGAAGGVALSSLTSRNSQRPAYGY